MKSAINYYSESDLDSISDEVSHFNSDAGFDESKSIAIKVNDISGVSEAHSCICVSSPMSNA